MDEFEWGWICIDDNEMLVGCPAGGGGGLIYKEQHGNQWGELLIGCWEVKGLKLSSNWYLLEILWCEIMWIGICSGWLWNKIKLCKCNKCLWMIRIVWFKKEMYHWLSLLFFFFLVHQSYVDTTPTRKLFISFSCLPTSGCYLNN